MSNIVRGTTFQVERALESLGGIGGLACLEQHAHLLSARIFGFLSSRSVELSPLTAECGVGPKPT